MNVFTHFGHRQFFLIESKVTVWFVELAAKLVVGVTMASRIGVHSARAALARDTVEVDVRMMPLLPLPRTVSSVSASDTTDADELAVGVRTTP